jgi:hypothetical protein
VALCPLYLSSFGKNLIIMKSLLYIFLATVLYSCTDKPDRKKVAVEEEYPKIVDSLGAQKYYDDAKWKISCIYCDDTVTYQISRSMKEDTDLKTNLTYGMIPVKCEWVNFRSNDTLEMSFLHYLNDSTYSSYRYLKGFESIKGIAYSILGDSILYYLGPLGRQTIECGSPCPARSINPLQPEVIAYIKKNRDKLDPWFRVEAVKRGVFK